FCRISVASRRLKLYSTAPRALRAPGTSAECPTSTIRRNAARSQTASLAGGAACAHAGSPARCQDRSGRRTSEAVPARRRGTLNRVFDLMAGVDAPIRSLHNGGNMVFLRRPRPGRPWPVRGARRRATIAVDDTGRSTVDQGIINLYDRFTHGGMSRRDFLDRLAELARS